MIDRTVVECGENSEIKNALKKHTVICSELIIYAFWNQSLLILSLKFLAEQQTVFKNIKTKLTKTDKMYSATQPNELSAQWNNYTD